MFSQFICNLLQHKYFILRSRFVLFQCSGCLLQCDTRVSKHVIPAGIEQMNETILADSTFSVKTRNINTVIISFFGFSTSRRNKRIAKSLKETEMISFPAAGRLGGISCVSSDDLRLSAADS